MNIQETEQPLALLGPAPAWIIELVCPNCLEVGFACQCPPSEAELLAECADVCPGGSIRCLIPHKPHAKVKRSIPSGLSVINPYTDPKGFKAK